MFAPLSIYFNWSHGVDLLVSFAIGLGFGFFLERAGFGNAKKLAMQFYLRDLTVFKVMFSAMITAMTGIIFFNAFGWLDLQSMYIVPTYMWSAIAGGLIMGVGFAIGGYCPGTSLAGLATLKVDAVFYILGLFFGVFTFSELYPIIESLYGGEYSGYMGTITIYQYLGVSAGVVGFAVIIMALGGFVGAEWVEKKFGSDSSS